ncbi:MAG: ferredoxin [Acidobacteria bacterium]|nr:ferredoxin [Acidobacteriota bacterium]
MQANFQDQIAFYLTGRREGSKLQPLDGSYRPALFARVSDLASLRYDLPLILNVNGTPDRAVLSLSHLIDDAVESLGESADRDRIARHGYKLELELRKGSTTNGSGDFGKLWNDAAARLSNNADPSMEDSAKKLWSHFDAAGTLVDADAEFPSRVVYHAWNAVQETKAKRFREKAERLMLRLRDILDAETVGSAAGRAPDRLRAGVGTSFGTTFDFNAMSRILVEGKPGFELSGERRTRIKGLIEVLERQRFYPVGKNVDEPYSFAFFKCCDALDAYQERHDEAVELLRTLAIADLETKGEYRESVHDVLFDGFGANGLDAEELAELPDYLVCTDAGTLDAVDTAKMVELLAAGLPIKVLVRTDDVLEPSKVAEGHVALGLRARQIVDTAIGLTDVFVYQSGASHLFSMRESMIRALSYEGPALFSVFSGATGHNADVPPYLVAAAAMESRVFPAMVYDPSAGSDWATRLAVSENPSLDDDWPVHNFAFEDETLQAGSETLAFTLADFMSMDDRFFGHFAIVPTDESIDVLIPVPKALETVVASMPNEIPVVMLVDSDGCVRRAIVDDRLLRETRRCLTMWHSLQELGGIHNSHAKRLLAKELKSRLAETTAKPQTAEAPPAEAAVASEPVAAVAATNVEPVAEKHGDDPYIESTRCTTCNECTNLNPRMFAYNAEKQAYIADPDACTYRQLVEAAEGCQVSIIHPGKPRNLKEPGIEDLIRRAAEFN